MRSWPRVTQVEALARRRLRVVFADGQQRIYDCEPLLDRPAFSALRDPAFFAAVQPDPHGYGVVWDDTVDLAESELWLNGSPATP